MKCGKGLKRKRTSECEKKRVEEEEDGGHLAQLFVPSDGYAPLDCF